MKTKRDESRKAKVWNVDAGVVLTDSGLDTNRTRRGDAGRRGFHGDRFGITNSPVCKCCSSAATLVTLQHTVNTTCCVQYCTDVSCQCRWQYHDHLE